MALLAFLGPMVLLVNQERLELLEIRDHEVSPELTASQENLAHLMMSRDPLDLKETREKREHLVHREKREILVTLGRKENR